MGQPGPQLEFWPVIIVIRPHRKSPIRLGLQGRSDRLQSSGPQKGTRICLRVPRGIAQGQVERMPIGGEVGRGRPEVWWNAQSPENGRALRARIETILRLSAFFAGKPRSLPHSPGWAGISRAHRIWEPDERRIVKLRAVSARLRASVWRTELGVVRCAGLSPWGFTAAS